MRKLFLILSASSLCLATYAQSTCGGLAGIYKIGNGGNYPTLTAAISALQTNGIGGNVILELKANYISTAEVFPLGFYALSCLNATRTLTLRPEASATALELRASANNNPTVDISNTRYMTIDGRPGGTGNTSALTISNLSPTGSALRFQNNASNNNFTYVRLTSNNASAVSGVVTFSGSVNSISTGSNNNVLSNCIIDGARTAANGVYAVGATGKKNISNRIQNCQILDLTSSTNSNQSSYGIFLGANNTNWEIVGNSIYNTIGGGLSYGPLGGIKVDDATSTGFLIQNNYIGGVAANCGGLAWNVTGGQFRGIDILAGTAAFSTVQGNTVANFKWRSYTSSDYFAGIQVSGGKVDCSSNIVGSPTLYGNIAATIGNSMIVGVYGILAGDNSIGATPTAIFDTVRIRTNQVGGIRVAANDPSYTQSTGVTGIAVQGQASGYMEITGNTIGSTTTRASIDNFLSNGSSGGQYAVRGIACWTSDAAGNVVGGPIRNLIANNLVTNLHGSTQALQLYGGRQKLLNNTVRNIYADDAGIVGIEIIYSGEGTEVTGNVLHTLVTRGPNNHGVLGMYIDLSEKVLVTKNLIHSLLTENQSGSLIGISVYSGTGQYPSHGGHNFQNNMIRLGVDTTGAIMNSRPNEVIGIIAPMDSITITHNSIYLDGSGDNAASCLYLEGYNARVSRITNNILVNKRTGAGFNSNSYALRMDASINNLSALTMNNNLYQFVSATGSYMATYRNINYSTLAAWRAATGKDAQALLINPLLVNPTGTPATINLHLSAGSPAEAAGMNEPAVPQDFDSDVRANLTPVDIGADAGNYAVSTAIAAVLEPGEKIEVLPNPTKGPLTVQLQINGRKRVGFVLTDAMGSRLRTWPEAVVSAVATRHFDLSGTAAGVYYLKIILNGKVIMQRVVVQ
jgi:hypothetical protein